MKLTAEKRTPGDSKALRRHGRLPGIVYNSKLNIPVSVEYRAFDKAFREQGTSSIIDLQVDGKTHEVLVKAVQMDKRRREPMHVDFYAVTAGQAVQVHLPIEYVGKSVGVKEGGLVDIQRREIFISILPRLIPQHLEVDISALAIGDSLHVRDITHLLPSEAEVLDDPESALVAIVPPRLVEEPEEAVEEEEAEPEVIGRGAEDEDDAESQD